MRGRKQNGRARRNGVGTQRRTAGAPTSSATASHQARTGRREGPTATEIAAQRDAAQLVLRVRDYGSWTEHDRSDLRGRGISMIDQLMDAVDIKQHPQGTEILMRHDLPTNTSSDAAAAPVEVAPKTSTLAG